MCNSDLNEITIKDIYSCIRFTQESLVSLPSKRILSNSVEKYNRDHLKVVSGGTADYLKIQHLNFFGLYTALIVFTKS